MNYSRNFCDERSKFECQANKVIIFSHGLIEKTGKRKVSHACQQGAKSFETDFPLATTKGGLPRLGQTGRELTTTMGNCSGQQRILLPFGQQPSPSPCPPVQAPQEGEGPTTRMVAMPASPQALAHKECSHLWCPPGPECPLSWPGWGTGASEATCGGTHGPSAGSPLTRAPRAVLAPGGNHAGAL